MADSHKNSILPSFPRGFLLSEGPFEPPDGFIPGPILPGLSVHPWANVTSAGNIKEGFVIVIGTCVSVDPSAPTHDPSERLLSALRKSEDDFYEILDNCAGRHAVVWGMENDIRIASDATSMRSIFYSEKEGVVASHALLVEKTLGGEIQKSAIPFRYGHPGNRTPYSRTKLLTPNTAYNFTDKKVERFWPRAPLPERTVKDVALEVLMKASTAMRRIAEDRPVKMALTAGLDSRALLAVVLYSGIEFETYTYGRGRDTLMDRNLAGDLAAKMGIKHTTIETERPSADLQSRLDDAHYASHHQNAITPLRAWMEDVRTVAVTANLLEIARSFYKSAKVAGVCEPSTGEGMRDLHLRSTPRSGKEAITAWGEDKYNEEASEAFEEFIQDSKIRSATKYLDAFDVFYWEHRMSAWHGASMVERDFYAEAFIPFNTRSIFAAALGVREFERDTAAVFHEIIRLVDTRLTDLPINPKA